LATYFLVADEAAGSLDRLSERCWEAMPAPASPCWFRGRAARTLASPQETQWRCFKDKLCGWWEPGSVMPTRSSPWGTSFWLDVAMTP